MNRLTRWNNKTEQPELVDWDKEEWKEFMETFDVPVKMNLINAFEKLAELEDLEEHGLLKVLPCKIGTIVYYLKRYSNGSKWIRTGCDHLGETGYYENLYGYWIETKPFCYDDIDDLGKTVFLTKKEAEEKRKKILGER